MNNLLQGISVYLIGMMGSGKTTIGKYLSQQLDYRFIDTDTTIATIAEKSIPEIFATEGESYFREDYRRCAIQRGLAGDGASG